MSITQIASRLKISPASVSRALNGQPGVSADTRARVLTEAARLRFVPNGAARSLVTARTENVAFVLYHLPGSFSADPFYSRIMLGAEQELRRHGYHLLLTILDDDQIARPAEWSVVQGRRVDGLILAGPFIPPRFIISLHTQGVPLVLVDNALADVPIDAVLGDDREGARKAAAHLLDHGHTRIAIIAGPDDWFTTHERCAGFADALGARGVKPVVSLHAEETTYESGYRLAQEALSHQPTAILAVNDAMAMGAIDAVRAASLRVPDDVAVTGFDDIEVAERWTVPLTTVHLQKRYLGRIAVRHLLDRVADPESPQQRTLVATDLVVRRSCGCVEPNRSGSSATGM
jgi:LacI family transcriptional regulator